MALLAYIQGARRRMNLAGKPQARATHAEANSRSSLRRRRRRRLRICVSQERARTLRLWRNCACKASAYEVDVTAARRVGGGSFVAW